LSFSSPAFPLKVLLFVRPHCPVSWLLLSSPPPPLQSHYPPISGLPTPPENRIRCVRLTSVSFASFIPPPPPLPTLSHQRFFLVFSAQPTVFQVSPARVFFPLFFVSLFPAATSNTALVSTATLNTFFPGRPRTSLTFSSDAVTPFFLPSRKFCLPCFFSSVLLVPSGEFPFFFP